VHCSECERLKQAYVDASKRTINLGYVPKNAARSKDRRAQIAADLEAKWTAARDAFHDHLKSHQNESVGSAETE